MEKVTMIFKQEDDKGTIKGEVEGTTNMPFLKHDLKMRTAIQLLNTVDEKDFEDRLEFEGYLLELEEILNSFRGL